MGLDCLPVPCTCGTHPRRSDIPEGLTHPERTPCPFDSDDFPKGILGSCCWLRGKVAARELEALHVDALALAIHEDMTAEEAHAFARELRDAADALQSRHANDDPKPKGAGWNGRFNPMRREIVWEDYSTFEDALAHIRQAADWYEKVAKLGFGVRAWY